MTVVNNLWFGDCVLYWATPLYNELHANRIGETITDPTTYDHLYMEPPTISQSDIKYRELLNARAMVYVSELVSLSGSGTLPVPEFYAIAEQWKQSNIVSYRDLPIVLDGPMYADKQDRTSFPTWMYADNLAIDDVRLLLNYGAMLKPFRNILWTPYSDAGPHLRLEQGDVVGLTVTQLYPTETAAISKSQPSTFQWLVEAASDNTLEPVTLLSSIFRWRYLGDDTEHEETVSSGFEYTVPAGTFEIGTIEWQVDVLSNSGVTTSSPWIQVAVSEAVSKPKALAPLTIVDGSKPIMFQWEHVISNGTKQTAFDLQTSRDLQTWEDALHEDTENNFATLPADTFASGPLYWRVRTYNQEGMAGEWSDTAQCIVLTAPTTPAVTIADSSPRFEIRWHQNDQQGYEIMLNESVIAKKYGESSLYRHTEYLLPGNYLAKVRIQNMYGMWSEWGAALLNIANYNEPTIAVRVNVQEHVVHLSWSTEGIYDRYFIYRNNVKIAEITGRAYTDQFAAGVVTYQVRGIYNDSGLCGLSQETHVSVDISNMMIAAAADPHWIMLSQSTSSLRVIALSKFRSVTYTHFIGAALPGADIGEAEPQSLALDSAWSNADLSKARAFEALTGKVVCIKTTTGDSIFAVFDGFHKSANRFWTSYQAQLTPIEWEEGSV